MEPAVVIASDEKGWVIAVAVSDANEARVVMVAVGASVWEADVVSVAGNDEARRSTTNIGSSCAQDGDNIVGTTTEFVTAAAAFVVGKYSLKRPRGCVNGNGREATCLLH